MRKRILLIALCAAVLTSSAGCSDGSQKLLDSEITDYFIYGTHFNLSGKFETENPDSIDAVYMVFSSEDFEFEVPLLFDTTSRGAEYTTSEYINSGIFLDALPAGKFRIIIKVKKGETTELYGAVNTKLFENMEYYSVTRNGKNMKIDIVSELSEDRLLLEIHAAEAKLPLNVYDIVIDPGHGGEEFPGAVGYTDSKSYAEKDLNFEIALRFKQKLESAGYKVALTRDGDYTVPFYGEGGRATLVNELKAKYLFSVHCNGNPSSSVRGTEIYIGNDSDAALGQSLADRIVEISGYRYSNLNNSEMKVTDGVYNRKFKAADVRGSEETAAEYGYEPFDIPVGTNYYLVIREVGGATTGAYHDGRHKLEGENMFRNSKNTAEGLLCELGYMSNSNNLRHLLDNKEKYAEGLFKGFDDYMKLMHGQNKYH